MGETLKVAVKIMPRPEALDPQGRAVHGALKKLGFTVDDCRVGKIVILEINEDVAASAILKAQQMAEKLLYNPLIETFEVYAL